MVNKKALLLTKLFGMYLVIVSIALVLVPNSVLPLFGFATTTEPWIRFGGLLLGILGYYYIVAANNSLLPLIKATVWGRLFFGSSLIAYSIYISTLAFAFFGFVDILTALITAALLKSSKL